MGASAAEIYDMFPPPEAGETQQNFLCLGTPAPRERGLPGAAVLFPRYQMDTSLPPSRTYSALSLK